jgi:hypothetical protein
MYYWVLSVGVTEKKRRTTGLFRAFYFTFLFPVVGAQTINFFLTFSLLAFSSTSQYLPTNMS